MGGRRVVSTALGDLPIEAAVEKDVVVLLRPDRLRPNGRGSYKLSGTLIERSFRGSMLRAVVEVAGLPLTLDIPSDDPLPEIGGEVELSFNPDEALQILR